VEQVTGFAPGAVSPFGLRQRLPILADRSILQHETVSVGAGIPNAGLILARDDLVRALSPRWAEFCNTSQRQAP
jgi:prolyl-tRNA editing enzyme YbaK/EbsC (Cys-tRNA(Pro) deacylase)